MPNITPLRATRTATGELMEARVVFYVPEGWHEPLWLDSWKPGLKSVKISIKPGINKKLALVINIHRLIYNLDIHTIQL